ncbi:MAG: 30S ribosomal protein S8 [Chloroflexota bacterium]|nr:30S ribosomal protein S8 [Chloroflexota bacterium]MDE3193341.1 30S ribosomal protein S8 [Chloroflexota bacterium]
MERTTTDAGAATDQAARPAAEPRVRRVVAAAKKPPKKKGVAVNDPVGDMLTRVRNAVGARHETVEIPTSRLKSDIAKILKAEGYISGYEANATALTIKLKYSGKISALTGADRVSRPGRRIYARRDELPRVLGGLGVAIVSTSAGVMTGREARRRRLGGEVLAQVW